MVNALNNRDYPVVSGINLVFATMVVGVNLMIDLIYPYLDPGSVLAKGEKSGYERRHRDTISRNCAKETFTAG